MVQVFRKKKLTVWISTREEEQQWQWAMKLKLYLRHEVRVVGYKAYCQGRAIGEAGSYYVVWEEGLIRTSNNL